MERSARVERLDAAWQAPGFAGFPAAGGALRRLLALPESLGVAIIVVGLFCLTVLAIAFVYGAPLSYPRERISLALGYSAVLPVVVAVILYVTLRLGRALIFRRGEGLGRIFQMVGTDITLMGLFLLATYFHFSLKTWVQLINPNLYDASYMAVDRAFYPVIELFNWIRSSYFTAVPNTDAWYQAAFLLMFICGFCSLAVTRNPVYSRFCVGVLLTICLGALSYLVAPALGPFLYEQGLNARATEAQAGMLWAHEQVMREGMSWIAEAGPSYFTGGLAAMPSLHMTHALVMSWFMIRARSLLIPFFLLICFWVVIESVVSRWHYLIDLPVGALLAVFIIWLTNRLCALSDRTT
ncbi:phosphatase PAP2 family protein [Pelagibius marinus]|uniref:phosphatase PAP2 family protein n=1 Tax=Pelagibius marinus TaxID=2762760 RepID=UPI00187253D4|nr:phosphatase PAP2 family protein [Pelagibius marinus]